MPEITVTGANGITWPSMSTWGWEIALYLFVGGLVAGLMIFSGVMRLARPGRFSRALLVADLTGLPLLGIGMFLLLLDLSNKVNVWRFYTTFQVRSAMSWGAWVLLVAMAMLALRFASRLQPISDLGFKTAERPVGISDLNPKSRTRWVKSLISSLQALIIRTWNLAVSAGRWAMTRDRALAFVGVALGIGVGFYTGVLLSTIPSRPLWNTAVLAPLFLVSGLASGGAFLCLFLPDEEHLHLVPVSILFCAVEIVLLVAYAINLTFGNNTAQRAGSILFDGAFGLTFWGLVVLLGLLVPATFEQLELMHRRVPGVPMRLPPVLKLTGSLALRFVIVYAGLVSFV
ncbi:MAG: polysulfide reductase NrfD [Chloroflexi bacterium]|nr:polysulfide reductase NrfD [Chloroflexota bacterium]